MFTRSTAATVPAGIFYAFCSFKLDHIAHLQITWSPWLPLLLAALLHYRRRPSLRTAALLAGAYVMNGLSNVHFLLFGSLAVALSLVLFAVAERHDRRFWLRAVAALAIGGLILLPFLIPYRIVSKEYSLKRGVDEARGGSAIPIDWLKTTPHNLLYGKLTSEGAETEKILFPGLLPILLMIAAAVLTPRRETEPAAPGRDRPRLRRFLDAAMIVLIVCSYLALAAPRIRWELQGTTVLTADNAHIPLMLLVICLLLRLGIRFPRAAGEQNLRTWLASSRFPLEAWTAALWIAAGFLGSFGLNAFFHGFLWRAVPVFQSLREPSRWAIVVYTGLVVWMAMGIELVAKKRWQLLAFIALAIAETVPVMNWELALTDPPPVYTWLKQTNAAPSIEIPVTDGGEAWYYYLLRSTYHHKPILNGISGFEPPLHRMIREHALNDGLFGILERSGCRTIIVHSDWLGRRAFETRSWLRSGLAARRLAFLRRFDDGVDGDWVFALTRVAHDWQQLRAPQTPDAAGFTPDQNLERFLNVQPTYNATPFVYVDSPKLLDEVRGPLRISGWALAPAGVREVWVTFGARKIRRQATLTDRGDVQAAIPWYPRVGHAGFELVLARPPGLQTATDVQVEVVDGEGRVARSRDLVISWQP